MAPVLAYWDIRGLAQPIRLLLSYAGQEFEDKKYSCGPAPDFDKSCWFGEKFNLGLDFPNLPYYIDGDIKLTQSMAIMRLLADKHNVVPTTLAEKARVYMAEYEVFDYRLQFTMMCYNPNFEKLKEDFAKNLPTKLKQFSDFLGKNRWIAGDALTYVDFLLYDTLDILRIFKSDCLNDFANLKEYVDRFESLPKICEYMKSDKFIKSPLNNKTAKFGNE